jgi:hypothetical protein
MTSPKHPLVYFVRNFSVVVGLVLVWRGIWYILDVFDQVLFSGQHFWTAVAGIGFGLIILYLPDHDLKEIEKL